MKNLLLIFIIFLSSSVSLFAQKKGQSKIDSLVAAFGSIKEDTVRLKVLNEVGRVYMNINADSTIVFANRALELAIKLHSTSGKGQALNTLGLGLKVKGNFTEALSNFHEAMKLYTELKDRSGMARLYNNIGNVYNVKNNYAEALKNYFAALAIRKELKDKNGTGGCLNNIGLVYFNQKNYDEALKYYVSARDTLINGGDRQFLANTIDNIGDIMEHNEHYKEAEIEYRRALLIRKDLADPGAVASSYSSLGHLSNLIGKYKEAEKYTLLSYEIAHTLGSIKLIKENAGLLADIYESLNNYKASKKYYIEYIAARDSMYNTESEKKLVEQQLNFAFERKTTLAKAEQAQKDAVAAERLKREKNTRLALIAGLGLLIVIAGIAIYAFRQKRKDNYVIKKLVNEQEQVIADRTKELAITNASLADSNKRLRDLIQYNAHQIREPLTRITGIMGVIDSINQEEFVNDIWPMMESAFFDLDNSIKNVIDVAQNDEA